MEMSKIKKLKEGDRVLHRHLGKSIVKEVMWSHDEFFGVVIKPDNEYGINILRAIIGNANGEPNYLEDSIRLLKLPAQSQ